ncbi:NAD(P)-dependent oxidoreductase, partial [Providencia rettgeri]|uniref:NAD(P)-dependent oxidoreductase n=1 Tax=Providencia rettgeri TaxID=587 RepID=UPI00287F6AB5
INTARSGLINESDLIEALKNGRIMGAAIDTFDDEPLKDNSEFYLFDNITITPHMAGSTLD